MVRKLSELSKVHKNQLESEWPFIWLFEIETLDDPPRRYRLTNFPERVEYGEDSDGKPIGYLPAPITHSGIKQGSSGDLPTIDITLATGGAFWLTSAVDDAVGFIGQPVRIILVSALELDNLDAAIDEVATVTGARMDERRITLSVSAFNVFRIKAPKFLYSRRTCRWVFGSNECGYNVNAVGAGFLTCPKTFDACVERGDDEEANPNVGERQHPKRFGAFIGIPRGARR